MEKGGQTHFIEGGVESLLLTLHSNCNSISSIFRLNDKTSYNSLGRTSSTLDSIGKTTSITYKPCGIKEKTSSYIGDTVNFDHLRRITTIYHMDDGQITYHHHSDKHIEIIDEENKHTHQYYTTFGTPGEKHLTSVKDAYNKTSTYTYNILGSLRYVNFGGTIRHFRTISRTIRVKSLPLTLVVLREA